MKIKLFDRAVGKRATKKKILIVCEGARTEPEYFRSFRVASDVCDIQGKGSNTLSLVKEAKQLNAKGDYSEVWCVFDKDSFPRRNVLAALKLADTLGFKCAFSNESFELWYVLHFEYLDTKITRSQYCSKLSKSLGVKYSKSSPTIYRTLLPKQDDAIRNAEKLYKSMRPPGSCAFECQPTTTVHLLVKRLNKLARGK
jgi:hypothetical protein